MGAVLRVVLHNLSLGFIWTRRVVYSSYETRICQDADLLLQRGAALVGMKCGGAEPLGA